MAKKDWLQYFPYETTRDIQETSIDFIIETLFEKDKKFCVVEAPVGTGKSAIAITLAKYVYEKISTPEKRAAWIVTTQKVLQEQYKIDFDWLPSIWSKSNYECVSRMGISCEFGLWVNSIFKGKYCDCIYTKDKKAFTDGQISLTNLPFMLNNVEYNGDEVEKRNLLIVDECHNLESAITDFVSVRINKFYMKEIGEKWPGSTATIDEVIRQIKVSIIPKLEEIKGDLETKVKNIGSGILKSSEGRQLVKKLDHVDRYKCQLDRCVAKFVPNEWVKDIDKDQENITLKPIFASNYSNQQLFKIADKVLLMSGTILNKKAFCNHIGIKESECEFISLPSPFKPENRPIFLLDSGSMSFKNIDKTLPKLVKTINSIINLEHKKDKGIIHCHSYKVANYLYKNLKNNRLLLHDSTNRLEVFNTHINSNEPTILLSPSFTEGIDLIGELSKFQIIVKIPFMYLGDYYVRAKMKRVPGWYEWNTVKTIIQSSGRSVRDENDSAITYITDSDWRFFYYKNQKLFPKWFRDAIVEI